ncbi:MarR family transcriptional regulator [Sphaerisporangium sp. NPDC049003]|uniref:MarR family transcriptional regulator n=1 Tax=Sphaerisporangium sp. NPDC049003 TaxID=3364517 RepID=UPI00371E9628
MPHDETVDVLEAVERQTASLFAQANRLVEALAARVGLDATHFRCLSVLCRQGPMSVRCLAALAGLTDEEATEVVCHLEHDGYAARRREADSHRILVHPDRVAHRARVEPALRELREAWYPLVRRRCDDLGLVAALMAESRRLSDLSMTFRTQPEAFTM